MKHFTLLTLALLAPICLLQAQRSAAATSNAVSGFAAARMIVDDTLFSPTLSEACSEEVFIFEPTGADQTGYVAGSNSFLDKEKGIVLTYDQAATFSVTDVIAYFFPADNEDILDAQILAFVSAVNADGSPGELLGESDPIIIDDLNTNDGEVLPTIFTFSTPVELSSPTFFVSIDFTDIYNSEFGDIGLWMTDVDCAATPNPSWELWDDDTWHNIEDQDSWGQTSEWLVGAVVNAQPSSIRHPLLDINLSISPNPSRGIVQLTYNLPQAEDLQFELISSIGQSLYQESFGRQLAGNGVQSIDLSTMDAGLYFYRIRMASGEVSGSLILE